MKKNKPVPRFSRAMKGLVPPTGAMTVTKSVEMDPSKALLLPGGGHAILEDPQAKKGPKTVVVAAGPNRTSGIMEAVATQAMLAHNPQMRAEAKEQLDQYVAHAVGLPAPFNPTAIEVEYKVEGVPAPLPVADLEQAVAAAGEPAEDYSPMSWMETFIINILQTGAEFKEWSHHALEYVKQTPKMRIKTDGRVFYQNLQATDNQMRHLLASAKDMLGQGADQKLEEHKNYAADLKRTVANARPDRRRALQDYNLLVGQADDFTAAVLMDSQIKTLEVHNLAEGDQGMMLDFMMDMEKLAEKYRKKKAKAAHKAGKEEKSHE